jgi:hypothetical protein
MSKNFKNLKRSVSLASVPAPLESAVAEATPEIQVTPVAAPKKARYLPTQRISVLYMGNPKRPATQEWRRWDVLRDGMTVADYCLLLKSHGGNAASMLTHIVAKGWAEIA